MSLSEAIDRLELALEKELAAKTLAAEILLATEGVDAAMVLAIRLQYARIVSILMRMDDAGLWHVALPLLNALSARVAQSALFHQTEIHELAFARFLYLVGVRDIPEALRLAEELQCVSDLPPRLRHALDVHIGSLHALLGKPDAVPLLRNAIQQIANDGDEVLVAKAKLDLARAITESGEDPREAESLLRAVIPSIARFFERSLLEAFSHDVLGRALSLQGRYIGARKEFERALEIVRMAVGPRHPTLATALLNLASVCFMQGDYLEAEQLLDVADSIVQALGNEDPALVGLLHTRMGICAHTGDDDDAERHARRLLELLDTVPMHPAFRAGALVKMGDAAKRRKEYVAARAYYREAEPFLAGTPYADLVASSLADISLLTGDLDDALARYVHLVDARRERGHERTIEYAHALLGLARIGLARSSWQEAKDLAGRVFDVIEACTGPQSVDLVNPLRTIACALIGMAKYADAARVLRRASEIEDRYLVASLRFLPSTRQADVLRHFRQTLEIAVSVHLDYAPTDPTCGRICMEMLLRRKGLYLEMARNRIVAAHDDRRSEDERRLAQRLHEIHQTLTNHAVRPALSGMANVPEHVIHSLLDEKEVLEKKLGAYEAQMARPTRAGVMASLSSGEVYVDYLAYSTVDPTRENVLLREGAAGFSFGMFWFRSDGTCGAEKVPVSDALLGHIAAFQKDLHKERISGSAQEIYRELLGRLPHDVACASHLRISPDHLLWSIPFAALAPSCDRMIVDRTAVTYVDSAYDLLPRARPSSRQGVVIIANPDFYAEIDADEGNEDEQWHPFDVPAVPGGEEEQAVLNDLFPWAEVWSGAMATKSAMMVRLHGPAILHILTHGKFVGDRVPNDLKLTQSILTLAGFNHGLHGIRHGALSAMEATLLDMKGTELVTLSACVTGVGLPEPGQASMSLRTAFQIAGARSQIVSLWPVPGLATTRLMAMFYTAILAGQPREIAMQEAQRALAQHLPPGFWAGFVLFGATGPISIPALPEAIDAGASSPRSQPQPISA